MIGLNTLRKITNIAILLALGVVMLGAFTRLTDAGLGCPDWPGCYGHMVLPSADGILVQAQANFPALPIESQKAWTEMAHRYAAGTLGILILFINGLVFTLRRRNWVIPTGAPLFLIGLLVFQALLGMWTVTLKLLPVVVMSHLLGGIIIFSTLVFFRWQLSLKKRVPASGIGWVILGVAVVLFQIALGGWVSSNYAGISCVGFPKCNGQWWPTLNFSQGFNLFSPVGENYQGGLLDNPVRVTIQFIHRLGGVITALYVIFLTSYLWRRSQNKTIRLVSILAFAIVVLQFLLGITNVLYLLPLPIAVIHNGVAALLLAAMISLFYLVRGEYRNARPN